METHTIENDNLIEHTQNVHINTKLYKRSNTLRRVEIVTRTHPVASGQLSLFRSVVENLSNFVVAATSVTPTVTSPRELSPSDYDVCATRVDPIPASTTMTFRCESTDVFGRYLFVLRQDSGHLQLCEVEVFVYNGTLL